MADETNHPLSFDTGSPIDSNGEVRCPEMVAHVLYMNYKREVNWRRIIPLSQIPEFGDSHHPYHPNQWILRVWDLDKNAERSYALGGIFMWMTPTLWNGLPERYKSDYLNWFKHAVQSTNVTIEVNPKGTTKPE